MTAEIVIMNRTGVSLAADSAVTSGVMSVKKIFTSANKIFTLSKYNPIGIMFYNLASFMGIPWEILIKDYRHKLGEKDFSKIEDAANDFIKYIKKINISEDAQHRYIKSSLRLYFTTARNCISEELRKKHGDKLADAKISLSEIEEEFINYFESEISAFDTFTPNSLYEEVSQEEFVEHYDEIIQEIAEECITEIKNFGDKSKNIVRKVSYLYFSKKFTQDYSGLVIVGYGKDTYFPSLRSYIIYGKVMNNLVYSTYINDDITLDTGYGARIYSFAQDEMAQIFTQGIDKKYKTDILRYFNDILDNYSSALFGIVKQYIPKDIQNTILEKLKESDRDIFEKSIADLNSYEQERFLFPLLRIIEIMPKEELSNLAEALVSITALKMKVTLQDETVGGPTDVAVITKGDGFVWIKRKHYFEPKFNSSFFMNYQRSYRYEGNNKK